jgi:hypothetical protein
MRAKLRNMAQHDLEPMDEKDAVAVRLVAAGAGLAATWLANTIIRAVWKKASGKDVPKDTNDPAMGIISAVAFAALSGAVAVLAKRVATHGASRVLGSMVGK